MENMRIRNGKPVSINEPVTDLRKVKILESGDPLVDYRKLFPDLGVASPVFVYERAFYARLGLAQRLAEANELLLRRGYRLSVLECWRPPHIQRRMYRSTWLRFATKHPEWSETKLRRVVNRFTAPMNDRVPPPHSTGGAVDLWLETSDGFELEHRAPFDRFDSACYPFAAKGLTDEARRHRDLLAEAILPTGITNYPSEYWHWSFGDQGWAYRGGHDSAMYGVVSPENYVAPENDVNDLPLNRFEE